MPACPGALRPGRRRHSHGIALAVPALQDKSPGLIRPGRLEPHGEGCLFQVQGPAAAHADGAATGRGREQASPLCLPAGLQRCRPRRDRCSPARSDRRRVRRHPAGRSRSRAQGLRAARRRRRASRGRPARPRRDPCYGRRQSVAFHGVSFHSVRVARRTSPDTIGSRLRNLAASGPLGRWSGGWVEDHDPQLLGGDQVPPRKACIRSSAGTPCRTSSRP